MVDRTPRSTRTRRTSDRKKRSRSATGKTPLTSSRKIRKAGKFRDSLGREVGSGGRKKTSPPKFAKKVRKWVKTWVKQGHLDVFKWVPKEGSSLAVATPAPTHSSAKEEKNKEPVALVTVSPHSRRVEVLWPGDGVWYPGRVVEHEASTADGKSIFYDTGEIEHGVEAPRIRESSETTSAGA